MDKKPPPVKELYNKMFKALAEKYSTGEIRTQKINGFRTSCEVAFVKLFSDKNGEEKNKAILVFNEDEDKSIIVFAPAEFKNGKELKSLFEISSSGKSGEPNASFGEHSCGIARVMRFRTKHDAYAFRAEA